MFVIFFMIEKSVELKRPENVPVLYLLKIISVENCKENKRFNILIFILLF